jgi:hypothetical protein
MLSCCWPSAASSSLTRVSRDTTDGRSCCLIQKCCRGPCACRGRSFRLHLLRFHLCFLSNGFVSRRSPEYHQVRHVPPPLFQTPLQRSKLAARIGIRVLRPKAGKQFCRRSPGLSLKPGAELNGHECERIRCVALLPRPWRLPPSRRSNLPLLPCGPQTEEELFERRLFDQERNLRRVGNFYQPSLTSTNVVQQADRIEGLKLRLTDRAHIITTGTDSYRFRRTTAQRKGGRA